MIKNIIFDLGGVLYNVDYQTTVQRLSDLFFRTMEFSQEKEWQIIAEYEKGNISTEMFREKLSAAFDYEGNIENDTFDDAWNSMLKGFYEYAEPVLDTLVRRGYAIAILSNINSLHLQYIQKKSPSIFSSVKHVFFSCEIGLRKPELSCFQHVLDTCAWDPQETLFVDDAERHCNAAASLGIHTLHWKPFPYSVEQVLYTINER